MRHIEKIGQVGPSHIHILDTAHGELSVGNNTILIDRSVIDELKFIREGHFVEKAGSPTLKLIGNISGVLDADRIIYAESAYPYTMSHVLAECGINSYAFQALAWKFGLKKDIKYHTTVTAGQKSEIHKYSKAVVELIRAEMRKDPRVIDIVKRQYSKRKKSKEERQALGILQDPANNDLPMKNIMANYALYYPTIEFRNYSWLWSASLV